MLGLCSIVLAQTDKTSAITNPGFEQNLTGWQNDGMAAQSNSAFKLKVGNTYCEKWIAKGSKVPNASIMQMVEGLEAGTYTVTVVAQNIQEDTPTAKQTGAYVVANDDRTEVGVAGTYSVTTTTVDGRINLGYLLSGATGNYVTIDDFHLTLNAPTAASYTMMHSMMQLIVNEAKSIDKHLATKEQTEMDNACKAVEDLIAEDTSTGVTAAVCRLQDAIYDYRLAIASEEQYIDMTSAITNPSFEINGIAGWTSKGMVAQTNSSFSIKQGNTYVEAWTTKGKKIGDVSISQTITVPNGKYVLTAAAQNIQENTPTTVYGGAYLFGSDYKTNVGIRKEYSLEFVVIDGQANIGFMTSGAGGNWVSVDNFQLKYQGRSDAMLLAALAERISAANTLTASRMNGTVLKNLKTAIDNAEKQRTPEGMEPVALALAEAMQKAEASIADYASLYDAITKRTAELKGGKGVDEFKSAIAKAQADYDSDVMTAASVAEDIKALDKASLIYLLANATGTAPKVETVPFIARGATGALGRSVVSGTNIMEKGFCWATHPDPTVLDNRSTTSYENNGSIYLMQPLEPSTVYYVRAYAMTKTYAVGYGEVRKVITSPMGTSSWWYNNGGSPAENDRINSALEDCIKYYNNWSYIRDFHITCSYGAATPTADCSYGGSMRVGPNASYQRTGTILHESNHGVGIGTSARWNDTNLHEGKWKGDRANRMLQFLQNDPTATMAGDGMHMWPYGINGANEDTGSPLLYIGNVLITNAMHEDGLCPPGHGMTPAYTYESEDTVKYYLTSENDAYGSANAFLTESSTGALRWVTAGAADLANDDAFAWYIVFNPKNSLYRIRNAKSGKYFTYAGNSIKSVTKATPGDTEYIHIMEGRVDKVFGDDDKAPRSRGYWLLAGADVSSPVALAAAASGATTSATFNISNDATSQRWVILTYKEAENLTGGMIGTAKDRLKRYIDGAKQMTSVEYSESTEGAGEELRTQALSLDARLESMTSVAEVNTETENLRNAIVAFMEVAEPTDFAQPFDVTCFLEEPDMETVDSWTCEPMPTLNHGIAEYFETSYSMTQNLIKMPKGIYEFKVQALQRPGKMDDVYAEWLTETSNVTGYIYGKLTTNRSSLANIMEGASDVSLGGDEKIVGDQYVPNDMTAAANYFEAGKYDVSTIFKQGSKTNMTVGVKSTSSVTADWTAFDNFRLYFYGANTTKEDVVGITSTPDAKYSDGKIYDLSGRIVRNPVKGVYIKGGKKIIF